MSHVVGRMLAVIGLIVLIIAAIFLVISLISINFEYNLVHAVANPAYKVAAATGLALIAGLLLGLGLAYSTRRVRPTVTDRPLTPPR